MSSLWLSFLLINSIILIKNWRIFRIFHNPSQRDRVSVLAHVFVPIFPLEVFIKHSAIRLDGYYLCSSHYITHNDTTF